MEVVGIIGGTALDVAVVQKVPEYLGLYCAYIAKPWKEIEAPAVIYVNLTLTRFIPPPQIINKNHKCCKTDSLTEKNRLDLESKSIFFFPLVSALFVHDITILCKYVKH